MQHSYSTIFALTATSITLLPFSILNAAPSPSPTATSKPARRVVTFANSYRGLRTGKSTLQDTIRVFGKPISTTPTPNGNNYRFPKVMVNISGRDRLHINTITIDKDHSYVTSSGVRLGQSISITRQRLSRFIEQKGWIYDNQRGVIFWHNGQRVTKIVLINKGYIS